MDLQLQNRSTGKKSELGRIRREGGIPAVLYLEGKGTIHVIVNGAAFEALLRKMPKGCLATQIFSVSYEGKALKVIVKDIAYNPTSYATSHLDLMQVQDDKTVSVYIPILCKGEDSCVGVTLGGQIKKVKRSLKTTVKVKEIPDSFVIDVTNLGLGETFRVRDLEKKPSMRIHLAENQVLVSVSK